MIQLFGEPELFRLRGSADKNENLLNGNRSRAVFILRRIYFDTLLRPVGGQVLFPTELLKRG